MLYIYFGISLIPLRASSAFKGDAQALAVYVSTIFELIIVYALTHTHFIVYVLIDSHNNLVKS